jgi:hypothetical protein
MPTPPTGPALWYKADAGIYKDAGTTLCSDGDTIAQITDWSGNGRHAGLVPFPTKPIYRTNPAPTAGLGLPLIDFTNLLAGLHTGASLPGPAFTILCVYSAPSTVGFYRAVEGTGASNYLIGAADGFIANYAAGFVSQNAVPSLGINQLVRTAATNTGSASAFFVNGVDVTQNPANVGQAFNLDLSAAGPSNQGLGGYLAEVLAYNRVLTPSELTQANTYLGRWLAAAPVRPWWLWATQQVIRPY